MVHTTRQRSSLPATLAAIGATVELVTRIVAEPK